MFLCVSTKEPVQKNSFVNSLFSPFVSLSPGCIQELCRAVSGRQVNLGIPCLY